MFMGVPYPTVFGIEGLTNMDYHYHLPGFRGYPEALSSVEYNSSCACKCVKYLELTCPITGPVCAVLCQIHKHLQGMRP